MPIANMALIGAAAAAEQATAGVLCRRWAESKPRRYNKAMEKRTYPQMRERE
jgi:hypothetical protein